jgi:hypothetical protein
MKDVIVVTNRTLTELEVSDDARIYRSCPLLTHLTRVMNSPNPLEPAHVDLGTPFLASASDAQELYIYICCSMTRLHHSSIFPLSRILAPYIENRIVKYVTQCAVLGTTEVAF